MTLEGPWLVSYVALWMLAAAEGLALAALLRQIGLLHVRIQPTGARTGNKGPDIGTHLEQSTGTDVFGGKIGVVEPGWRSLLVFVSPGCTACEQLLPAIEGLARSERRRGLRVVLLTSAAGEEARGFALEHKLDVPLVTEVNLAADFQVTSTPFAVAVDESGTVQAKGIVNNIEHLDSLVEALESGHATLESYLGANGSEQYAKSR